MNEGPTLILNISCRGCKYLVSESYQVQSDWGFDHYCTHSVHTERKHIGDCRTVTPDWCPIVDPVKTKQMTEVIRHRRIPNTVIDNELEAKAKKRYVDSLDDSIHCNRHPSWEELSHSERLDLIYKEARGH